MQTTRVAIALALLTQSSSLIAQEWTQFRGPNASGISPAQSIPIEVNEKTQAWRIKLPGIGHSSPVLWGNRLFVTSAEQTVGKRHLVCVAADSGKILWQKSFDFKPYTLHQYSSSASATPCVDSERVYSTWSSDDAFLVVAHNHAGNETWRRDFGPHHTQHGGASNPIICGDLLILAKENEDGPGLILGLDRKTGATRWQIKRESAATAYGTPILYQPKSGGPLVIYNSTAQGMVAIDPASGKVAWDLPNLSAFRVCSGAVLSGDLITYTTGVGNGSRKMVAVRPPDQTKSGKPEQAYSLSRGTSYVPSPIATLGRIYYWGDNGIVTCTTASTGATIWQERVADSNFFSSPILAAGMLMNTSAKGDLIAIDVKGPQFKLAARSPLGEGSHSTAAISGGRVFIRTFGALISLK